MRLTGLRSNGRAAPAIFVTRGGDGARPGVGGRLGFDDATLRFTGSGADLELDVDSMLGISISGRSVAGDRDRRGRGVRGTMRVAAVGGQSAAEWIFAIDRGAAVRLRSEVNRELVSRGKAELPYIEELESALAPPPALPVVDSAGTAGAKPDRPAKSGRRKALPWILLGAALVIAEVVVPLLILKGG
jgi:hypothetical protein